MNTYEITYVEHLVHHFMVDAESEAAAVEEFDRMRAEGELDFSDGDLSESYITYINKLW